jgi:site-specific DNA-methyltransferase (adenine-specific)
MGPACLCRPRKRDGEVWGVSGYVRVFEDDCRDVLRTLPDNSIDSVVTDPPYALVSIGKRFGADDAAPAKGNHANGAYQRASAGFMGKRWDTGETAFTAEFWAEVLRILKPGGHVATFGGTRTYHRLACAIGGGK